MPPVQAVPKIAWADLVESEQAELEYEAEASEKKAEGEEKVESDESEEQGEEKAECMEEGDVKIADPTPSFGSLVKVLRILQAAEKAPGQPVPALAEAVRMAKAAVERARPHRAHNGHPHAEQEKLTETGDQEKVKKAPRRRHRH